MESDSYPEQWAFITDPSPLKAALTTRRAGKSMGDAQYLLVEGMRTPGCSMLYTGLTDDSAWRILWKDCLRPLGKRYGITLKALRGDLAVRMEEYGSIIYFLGLENSEDEMSKVFGQKFRLAIIDEAALYKQNISLFVHDILLPAVADYDGTICLTGMPCNNTKTYFFDVTTGAVPGWSVHKWSWKDNRYVAEKLQKQLDFLTKNNPNFSTTPTYKMNYLGDWCVSYSARIYSYEPGRNSFDVLPESPNWHYVMGVDLGYDDPTAFVILAYRDYDPDLYVLEAYKQGGMTLSAVAEKIKHYSRIYKLERIIIDNSAKQAVEELKQRYGLSLTPADKSGKSDFAQIANDDLKHGRVKVRASYCEPLITEWSFLIWDEKVLNAKGIYVEPKRAVNHCADAFLYGWRYCYNWVDRGIEKQAPQSIDEKIDEFWRRQIDRGENQGIITGLEAEYGLRNE